MAVEIPPWQVHNYYPASREGRRKLPPTVRLFGVEVYIETLRRVLALPEAVWVVSIEGPGGIGKTALAGHLLRQPEIKQNFYDVAWVSARQQDFLASDGLESELIPALSEETLIDAILEGLDHSMALARPPQEKRAILLHLLKQKPYLVVIDNLERLVDASSLLPVLHRMANPTKFLLTSRHSLRAYTDVFCCPLTPLNKMAAFDFMHYEARMLGIPLPANAPEAELNEIYEAVRGNPLALKLVIGQMSILPLAQVLQMLKQALEKSISDLYTYIYWQVWQTLDEAGRQTLLVMPLTNGGALDQLLAVSELEQDDLHRALRQLVKLSLIQPESDPETQRYTIHRLTETFLLYEAIKWHVTGI